ncbi:MAG: response regulator [Acidaminococcales bacterium]|jgi:DNA-binding response OmpR family regulator|nr:response regulator [Acidaminococcales bacterium]
MTNTILLVEDDYNSALLLKDFFTLKGFTVDHVKDGLSAVKSITEKPYDMVLLDLRLPGQNGFVTTEKIRQTPEGAFVPIIVQTAFADAQNKLRAYQSGVNLVIAKPVDIKELFYIVNNLLLIRRP